MIESHIVLLRVLDILEIMFLRFPPELLHILNLRYLAFSYSSEELPSDITRLWSLQTLLIRSTVDVIALPPGMLQMAELRHIMVHKAEIKIESGNWNGMVLEKLQSISIITNPSVYFLERIPNIRNLQIGSVRKPCVSLQHHSKLETLKFRGLQLRLSPSLRSLSLTRCKLLGRFMRTLCDVEALKLHECDLGGEEWDATGQSFCKLQFLLLDRLKLVKWEAAGEASFPRLGHLVIRGCSDLEEIPSEIGEIMALKVIELGGRCRDSLVSSAEDIISERCDNGDNDLQLIVSDRIVQGEKC